MEKFLVQNYHVFVVPNNMIGPYKPYFDNDCIVLSHFSFLASCINVLAPCDKTIQRTRDNCGPHNNYFLNCNIITFTVLPVLAARIWLYAPVQLTETPNQKFTMMSIHI